MGNLKYMVIFLTLSFTLCSDGAPSSYENMAQNVRKMYKRPTDFARSLAYCKRQVEEYQPLALLTMYERMRALKVIGDLKIAAQLYDSIVHITPKKISVEFEKKLEHVKETLSKYVMVPQGAHLLESRRDANVTLIVDWMKMHRGPVADQILIQYWNNLRKKYDNPAAEVSDASKETRQNVYLLIALIKLNMENGKYDHELKDELNHVSHTELYNETVSQERKDEVNTILFRAHLDEYIRLRNYRMKEIQGIYEDSGRDYNKVIKFIDGLEGDLDDKYIYASAFYEVLKKARHVKDPLLAVKIYNHMKTYLPLGKFGPKLQRLVSFSEAAVYNSVVPGSVAMLDETLAHNQMPTIELIDNLLKTSEPLTNRVIWNLWQKKAENSNQGADSFSSISPMVKQKLYVLLALNKVNKASFRPVETLQTTINSIITDPFYTDTVPKSLKRRAEYMLDLSSPNIAATVRKYYNGSPSNFADVIMFMDDNFNTPRKADIILELYKVMKEKAHTDDVASAFEIFEAVDERLNSKPQELLPRQEKELKDVLATLATKLADGFKALESAMKEMKGNPAVWRLVDLLTMSENQDAIDATFGEIIKKVSDPLDPMLAIMSTDEQKAELLLSLYDVRGISAKTQKAIKEKLASMHDKHLSKKVRAQIRAIDFWFQEQVIRFKGGGKSYLQICAEKDTAACLKETPSDSSSFIAMSGTYKENTYFKIKHPTTNTFLTLLENSEVTDDKLSFNAFGKKEDSDDHYWSIHGDESGGGDGKMVVLSDVDNKQYLCSDRTVGVYTREIEGYEAHKGECKWEIEIVK